MVYLEAMRFLSQFGLGAVLISNDDIILESNEAADCLLADAGVLKGRTLSEILPDMTRQPPGTYINTAFSKYLTLCPTPVGVDLPAHTRLICFRDAASEVSHRMLGTIVNLIREPILLCDEKKRIMLVNDALMRMESLVPENVVGKDINEAYTCIDGNELTVPVVIANKKPIEDRRQAYTTLQGKRLDIMCNSYPIFEEGAILGVFCMTADVSRIEVLSQQIIDLQEGLLQKHPAAKKPQKSGLRAKFHFDDIICQSALMKEMIARCKMIARSDSSVMLYGETGTGKELVAQSIHNASNRADGPFLAINCAAIPENLLESMLFGTEKGAYTGAERRPGLFEQANGGTLLLDELNSMSMTLQAKLLRVLQDGVVRRVGGTEEKHVDVRVLSNINVPPYQAIAENALRQDVFYRLGVVNISIPALRRRKEDIPILIRSFFQQMNKKLSKSVSYVDEEVLAIFCAYNWPGNVRELQHCIEHAMNLLPYEETVIRKEYLPEHIQSVCGYQRLALETADDGMLEQVLSNVERCILTSAIQRNKGNISRAARQLGISRQNLQHRMKRNGLVLEDILSAKPRAD